MELFAAVSKLPVSQGMPVRCVFHNFKFQLDLNNIGGYQFVKWLQNQFFYVSWGQTVKMNPPSSTKSRPWNRWRCVCFTVGKLNDDTCRHVRGRPRRSGPRRRPRTKDMRRVETCFQTNVLGRPGCPCSQVMKVQPKRCSKNESPKAGSLWSGLA